MTAYDLAWYLFGVASGVTLESLRACGHKWATDKLAEMDDKS